MMKKEFKSFILLFGVLAIASLACQTATSQPGNNVPPPAEEIIPATEAPVPTQAASSSESSSEACAPFDSIPAATQYTSAPDILINTAGRYTATMRMAKGGEIFIELYADKAPITVNSFVFLACKGFYDNTTFHRVLPDFMAQGGDPTGTGMGGPGYEFVNEYSDLSFDKPGILAMANAGPDTNGSQFFITFNATEWLDGGYTIFGKVLQGMDVVLGITLRDPQVNPSFEGDVVESITISVNGE
jgi:cyclophilin family peptidyl-prolyl cis-trans isomerase